MDGLPLIRKHLEAHLQMLTRTIGERSVIRSGNLHRSAGYIHSFYESIGLSAHLAPYSFRDLRVSNVVAGIPGRSGAHYVVGAHYDSAAGTVGADDNASAVAVQLEIARQLQGKTQAGGAKNTVTFVSFALEESPAYGTRFMGSRVFAARARKDNLRIDGMICLEMVGYVCRSRGCQHYPFPLQFLGYPETGDFIGVVGNGGSRPLMRRLLPIMRRNRELPVVSLTVPFNGWGMPAVRLSDHASFWDEGYPAVMVTDTAFFRNPHYHLPSDTMDTLDIGFMGQVVKSLTGFLLAG